MSDRGTKRGTHATARLYEPREHMEHATANIFRLLLVSSSLCHRFRASLEIHFAAVVIPWYRERERGKTQLYCVRKFDTDRGENVV